ncbi:MAG: 3-phosphoserine/phosphohydroxythreonine transaminase [Acidobacteriota bacterium]
MTHRIHNFSAGPSALPLEVLEQVQRDLVDYQDSGLSILEMSHRSAIYDGVHTKATEDLASLLGTGDTHDILFMGGGARTQFATVAMNLLPEGSSASYLTTGRWSEMALAEAQKQGSARELYSSAEHGHDRVPSTGDYSVDPQAAYLHYTSNNTIAGTQYPDPPQSGAVPLVCDMSSDILSRPIDLAPFGVVYAGAQKNLGPAGVTVVAVRRDLLERSGSQLPDTMNYAKMAAKSSLLNTPPVFAIYITGLVAAKLIADGGLEAVTKRNEAKANRIYGVIDGSGGFYRGHAQPGSRSRMNITFRCSNHDLEPVLLEEAAGLDLSGLKGHRSVGGLRASIYNSVPQTSIEVLAQFLEDFARRHG